MNGVQVEQTLRVLGLTRCRNTVVGNALLRGISGGEKKRLTTAEMTGKRGRGHVWSVRWKDGWT
jgi:ABC-type multidrug transport system ATPase subunit